MYEVEFTIHTDEVQSAFEKARIPTSGISFETMGNRIFNAIGEAPMSSMGFSPSYDPGARGPTPRVGVFQPIRVTCTFPGYIVKGSGNASRYYLTQNDVRFFERLAKLYARRIDLAVEITIAATIRRLLEENEPNEANTESAAGLYSALTHYERVLVFEAGGNNSSYTIGFDALTRPAETYIEHYDGPDDEGDGEGV
jgi:hypothetical protein